MKLKSLECFSVLTCLFGVAPFFNKNIFGKIYPIFLILLIDIWNGVCIYGRVPVYQNHFAQVTTIMDILRVTTSIFLVNVGCFLTFRKGQQWIKLSIEFENVERLINQGGQFRQKQDKYFKTKICSIIYFLVWIVTVSFEFYLWSYILNFYKIFVIYSNEKIAKLFQTLLIILIQGFSEVATKWYQTLNVRVIAVCRLDNTKLLQDKLNEIRLMYNECYKVVGQFNDIFKWNIFFCLQTAGLQLLSIPSVIVTTISSGKDYYQIIIQSGLLVQELVSNVTLYFTKYKISERLSKSKTT